MSSNNQLTTRKRLNPARFHLTPEMTRNIAKDNKFVGKGSRIACIASSSVFFWRLVALSVTPFSIWGRTGFLILFAPAAVWICYMILPFVLAAIWRDSSQYHKRNYQRYHASYIYEHEGSEYEMNETGKGMYALLVKMDDSIPAIATVIMFLTFVGGWLGGFSLFGGWGLTLGSAFFAGYWMGILAFAVPAGAFCTYASIKCPINSGHMNDDAEQFAKHKERVDKVLSVQEVRAITEQANSLSTRTPAGSLSKGATLPKIGKGKDYDATAQYRTLPNAVDLEVNPMDDLPRKGGK